MHCLPLNPLKGTLTAKNFTCIKAPFRGFGGKGAGIKVQFVLHPMAIAYFKDKFSHYLRLQLKIFKMLSVKGIYEGGQIKLLEKVQSRKRSKVIITFIEENPRGEDEKLRSFASNTEAMSFWDNDAENIYQDLIPKVKK